VKHHPQSDEAVHSGDVFAGTPSSWYHFASLRELARRPVKLELPDGASFVGFIGDKGRPVVLGARCSHMGADLSLGCVKSGRIVCPLHGWEYNAAGACELIPASGTIPTFARQPAFPVEVRGGHVFFFNRTEPLFPMPFFDGVDHGELIAARPFEFEVDVPWYLVGANGFDAQHFRCAHDRTLVGEPVQDSRSPYSMRLTARFRVSGTAPLDTLTRWLSGNEVEMAVENWGGNLVLVTAKFPRTTTYGLVSFLPQSNGTTRLRDIVWIPRRRGLLSHLIDPMDAAIRRHFIREFVRSDVERSAGIRYHPSRMIAADKTLVDYLAWLQQIQRRSTAP
jgi:phenylpropionate dioxygenase-like ring-hydroxylating dioxygenase large terminal subunit